MLSNNVGTYRPYKENNEISFVACVYSLEYVLEAFLIQLIFLAPYI